MSVRISLILLIWPFALFGQGFAGLGTSVDGYAMPQSGYEFEFPKDHGPHPEFRIEWWYVTANLTGDDGQKYGVQWTLFRNALAPHEDLDWSSPQVWMGHAAVTSETQHFIAERFGRGGIGQAGANDQALEAWIDDWRMTDTKMTARGFNWSYDLSLKPNGPLILHGDKGYSIKSEDGHASYYYSQPFFEVEGTLLFPDGPVKVVGNAWLDREWSSQPLNADQEGWDWFSLTFESGEKLMAFRLRQTDGSYFYSGTWISTEGIATAIQNDQIFFEPLLEHRIGSVNLPIKWRVRLPLFGVNATLNALNANSWMSVAIPYWEGPVIVSGQKQGYGYLEMTGY